MQCPYCYSEVQDRDDFCKSCGQALLEQSCVSKTIELYWKDYQRKSDKEVEHARKIRVLNKRFNRKARNATLIFIVICCVIISTIAMLIFSRNMTNKKVLENVHKQMVGETYSDSEDSILFSGDNTDRYIITLLDQNQVEFIEGNYQMRLDADNHLTWSENEIYQHKTCTYALSISFLGKVSITILDQKYEVELSDDGSVNRIIVYED